MNTVYLIAFFILGLFFGSFYTVIGLRLPRKENFITTRSYCDTCHHELTLLDMVPILSYLFLRGRCRYCKAKIRDLSTYMELFTNMTLEEYDKYIKDFINKPSEGYDNFQTYLSLLTAEKPVSTGKNGEMEQLLEKITDF